MMSILAYAVVLTLCHGPAQANQCNDYYIATDESRTIALAELVHESDMFALAWTSDDSNEAIAHYLKRYNIVESPRTIVDYDYTIQPLHDSDIP